MGAIVPRQRAPAALWQAAPFAWSRHRKQPRDHALKMDAGFAAIVCDNQKIVVSCLLSSDLRIGVWTGRRRHELFDIAVYWLTARESGIFTLRSQLKPLKNINLVTKM
jgi:hypothetical protein